MLEVKNVSKNFGAQRALDRVNLMLEPGQTHVLLGSSGSGKTTLLRAMLGLIHCDKGEILFRGRAMNGISGYVPQGGGLFPHLTAADNAQIVARALGWPAERRRARMETLATLLALEPEHLKRKPSELSGGQKQRVALMRAAFIDPDILLLDEPLGALDPLIRADLQLELKEIFQRFKKTVVFVTHDIGEAAFLGDNIILMQSGRVVQKGTFADLRDRPTDEFVTRFLNAQRVSERGGSR